MENTLLSFNDIFLPLSAALGLSLVVERVIEFVKNFLKNFIGSHESRLIPKKKELDQKIKVVISAHDMDKESIDNEDKIQNLILELEKETNPEKKEDIKEMIEALSRKGEVEEVQKKSLILVEPATDPDDGKTLKVFIIQILGFAIGIVAARFSGLTLFQSLLGDSVSIPTEIDYILIVDAPDGAGNEIPDKIIDVGTAVEPVLHKLCEEVKTCIRYHDLMFNVQPLQRIIFLLLTSQR